MSTLKSSAENLTLNADGSGNDIIFQSNGSNVATLDQAGLLTATTFAGSGASLTAIPAANVTGNLPSANYIPRATPLIINGDMKVYQRGSVDLTDNASLYTLDRWRGFLRGGVLATATQDTSVPTTGGFANSLKIDVTTGDALTGASNDLAIISYTFEGQDLQYWKKGTADAETITIAFWIKSTITGTYILELHDGDNTRACSIAYTISVADTWEHKVVNFPADTTGALNDDNTLALYLHWYLGAGTNYTGGTLATTWASIDGDSTNRAEGTVNAVNSASNNIYITGVQVEVGTYTSATLPPFQHENYGDNLVRCKRYFQIYKASGSEWIYNQGNAAHTKFWQFRFEEMRVKPSVSYETSFIGSSGTTLGGTVSSLGADVGVTRCNARMTMSETGGGSNELHHTDNFENRIVSIDAEL